MNREDLIRKWLNGELSEEERITLAGSEDYESLEKLNTALRSFKAPEYDPVKELERLKDNLQPNEVKVVPIRWINTLVRSAAAITILVVAYFLFLHNPSLVVKTSAGEKSGLFLPDSSYVNLNANSRLSYKPENWEEDRFVDLDGEAFFNVAKGSTFKVNTNSGMVTVVGTQFNVKERDGFYSVACYEGVVEVRNGEEVIELTAGTIFRVINGDSETRNFSTNLALPTWISAVSSFESIPYKFVLEEFEMQYDVDIDEGDFDINKLFTGSFGHDNIEIAIEAISKPLNLTYTISEDGNITLKSEDQ